MIKKILLSTSAVVLCASMGMAKDYTVKFFSNSPKDPKAGLITGLSCQYDALNIDGNGYQRHITSQNGYDEKGGYHYLTYPEVKTANLRDSLGNAFSSNYTDYVHTRRSSTDSPGGLYLYNKGCLLAIQYDNKSYMCNIGVGMGLALGTKNWWVGYNHKDSTNAGMLGDSKNDFTCELASDPSKTRNFSIWGAQGASSEFYVL